MEGKAELPESLASGGGAGVERPGGGRRPATVGRPGPPGPV